MLLLGARAAGLSTELHTNAKKLDLLTAEKILPLIDRLGLSVDGPSPGVHDRFRDAPGNFAQNMRALEYAQRFGVSVTVRTLVARPNVRDLTGLGRLLSEYTCITKWSIREFAALGRGQLNQDRFELGRAAFLSRARALKEEASGPLTKSVAIVTREDMVRCFCLVNEDGNVYGHPAGTAYVSVGRYPSEPLALLLRRLEHDEGHELKERTEGRHDTLSIGDQTPTEHHHWSP